MLRWTCALLCSLVPLGCSSVYRANRLSDLTDAARLEFSMLSAGVMVNVGPIIAGHHGYIAGICNERRIALGPGGLQKVTDHGDVSGVLLPISRRKVYGREYLGFGSRQEKGRRDLQGYSAAAPGWASIGFEIGYLATVGARADLLELVDFLAGIAGVDLLGDDLNPTASAAPGAPP